MDWLSLSPDWEKIFSPSTPLIEIFVRGTLIYLALFFLLRFIVKRQAGKMGITDLLLIVLLADASQNAMAGEYVSVTDGLFLVVTIAGWSIFLDYLAFKSKRIERIIKPSNVMLIKNGKFLRRNMKREMLTEDELKSEIRTQGVSSVDEVKEAYMEQDGAISVIALDEKKHRR